FQTQKADQRSILVQIVEGESSDPAECVPLGQVVVRDLPTDLPAQSPIEVVFRYESNGRLAIDVRALGTDAALSHEIIRENTLTQAQLDAWRMHIAKLPPAPPSPSAPPDPLPR
ncbi:MAG TPA: Hsp70 family protein, partial [Pirellulaceae bacterium]